MKTEEIKTFVESEMLATLTGKFLERVNFGEKYAVEMLSKVMFWTCEVVNGLPSKSETYR